MTSVTHYADADENGVTIIDWGGASGEATFAPVPSLCRQGAENDFMSFFWSDVSCKNCLLLGDPR